MQPEYFSLPLALDKVMRQQELPKCTLQDSIKQHLHLLLTTGFGEFPADEHFGSMIWDNDFDNVTSAHKLKEIIRQSLLQTIRDKEKRLVNTRVELFMAQHELPDEKGIATIKKKIDITITGTVHLTNERLSFRDSFYIGPLSY